MWEPIDFIREVLDHDAGVVASSLKVLSTLPWASGQVVLYQYQARHHDKTRESRTFDAFGCQIFRQGPEGWTPMGGGSIDINNELPSSQAIQVAGGSIMSEQGHCTYLYGRIISPEVRVIEAEFDNGVVLRSESTAKCFAIVAEEATRLVAYRVYDSFGRVLRHGTWPPVATT